METFSFIEQLPHHKLADMLKNEEQAQQTMDDILGKKAYSMSDFFQYSGDQNKYRKVTIEALDEQQKLEERIEINVEALQKTRTQSLKDDLEIEIARDKARLSRVIDRLRRYSSSDNIIGMTQYITNQAYAKALDDLAVHIGEWFASGAAGPGTVTYEDKVFKAE